jgi:hypothetical protein
MKIEIKNESIKNEKNKNIIEKNKNSSNNEETAKFSIFVSDISNNITMYNIPSFD